MVRETVAFLNGDAVGRPGADQLVVVFVIGDRDRAVDNVANCAELCVECLFDDVGGDFEVFLFGFEAGFGCEEGAGVFFCL